jgi:hypothetical protein
LDEAYRQNEMLAKKLQAMRKAIVPEPQSMRDEAAQYELENTAHEPEGEE